MTLTDLINRLNQAPFDFKKVIELIDSEYKFTPTPFKNGDTFNEANTNNGSCKIFAFARLNKLSPQATLHAFGEFYTKDVLENPSGTDHQNIRNFIKYGWDGIKFEGEALTKNNAIKM